MTKVQKKSRMNNREIGAQYEARAADYLRERGYRILTMNFFCRMGEIDIVAHDGEYLVFVEVKYRANGALGSPLEAVDTRKQKRIIRAAQYYLMRQGCGMQVNCRFDVVAFDGNEVTLVQNAFCT